MSNMINCPRMSLHQWWRTDDIAAVISNEGLAVNVDELCDKRLGEQGMFPQAAECDVLRPQVLNWWGKHNHINHKGGCKTIEMCYETQRDLKWMWKEGAVKDGNGEWRADD